MRHTLISLLISLVTLSAYAGKIPQSRLAALKASYFASTLDSMTKPEDILRFHRKDKKNIEKELKKIKSPFLKPGVVMPKDNQVLVSQGNWKLPIEFSDSNPNVVLIGGEKVTAARHKTYQNYKGEIQWILRERLKKKSASFWIIPSADAAEIQGVYPDWLAPMLAEVVNVIFSSDNLLPEYEGYTAEEVIISAYAKDMQIALDSADANGASVRHLAFNCRDGHIDRINKIIPVFQGKAEGDAPYATLTRNDDGTFLYINPPRCPREYADVNGVLTQSTPGCAVQQGDDVFREPPFFGFGKFAESCCQTAGCYEKVSKVLRKIDSEILNFKRPETVQ